MRRFRLSLLAGVVAAAGTLMLYPQDADARHGHRGRSYAHRSHGFHTHVYRPYTTYYRPYRHYGYHPYARTYYRPYRYIPPTIGPSPYGYYGMIGPQPLVISPGRYYRF